MGIQRNSNTHSIHRTTTPNTRSSSDGSKQRKRSTQQPETKENQAISTRQARRHDYEIPTGHTRKIPF